MIKMKKVHLILRKVFTERLTVKIVEMHLRIQRFKRNALQKNMNSREKETVKIKKIIPKNMILKILKLIWEDKNGEG